MPGILDDAPGARSLGAWPRAIAVVVSLGEEPANEPGQSSEQLVEQANEADHIVQRLQDRADQIPQGSG